MSYRGKCLKTVPRSWKTLSKRTRVKEMVLFYIVEHLRIFGVSSPNLKSTSQNTPFDPHLTLNEKSMREVCYQ